MPEPHFPDTWLRELTIEFSDGSSETLHIERRETGTHIPRKRETPKPWTKLEFNKCPSCTLPGAMVFCPAALSLQTTMKKLSARRSIERVKAHAVTGDGGKLSVERDLQTIGATLVQLAVFETACPVGYKLKTAIAGLPPFSDSIQLMRHVTRKIMRRHGSVAASKHELQETLKPMQEVFIHLIKRLKGEVLAANPSQESSNDAVPNAIIQVDAIAQRFNMKIDALTAEIAEELGWPRTAP